MTRISDRQGVVTKQDLKALSKGKAKTKLRVVLASPTATDSAFKPTDTTIPFEYFHDNDWRALPLAHDLGIPLIYMSWAGADQEKTNMAVQILRINRTERSEDLIQDPPYPVTRGSVVLASPEGGPVCSHVVEVLTAFGFSTFKQIVDFFGSDYKHRTADVQPKFAQAFKA